MLMPSQTIEPPADEAVTLAEPPPWSEIEADPRWNDMPAETKWDSLNKWAVDLLEYRSRQPDFHPVEKTKVVNFVLGKHDAVFAGTSETRKAFAETASRGFKTGNGVDLIGRSSGPVESPPYGAPPDAGASDETQVALAKPPEKILPFSQWTQQDTIEHGRDRATAFFASKEADRRATELFEKKVAAKGALAPAEQDEMDAWIQERDLSDERIAALNKKEQDAKEQDAVLPRKLTEWGFGQNPMTRGQDAPGALATAGYQLASGLASQAAGVVRAVRPSLGQAGEKIEAGLQQAAQGSGAQATLNQSTSAGIGRGAGTVGSLVLGNPAGKLGIAAAAFRMSMQTESEMLASGASKEEAAAAARKSLGGMALFMGSGKLAAMGVSKLLGADASVAAIMAGGTGAALVSNIGVGSVLRAIEAPAGKEWEAAKPTVETLTVDTLFALMHGWGEYKKAMPIARMRAWQEFRRRGFREDDIIGEFTVTPGPAPADAVILPEKAGDATTIVEAKGAPPEVLKPVVTQEPKADAIVEQQADTPIAINAGKWLKVRGELVAQQSALGPVTAENKDEHGEIQDHLTTIDETLKSRGIEIPGEPQKPKDETTKTQGVPTVPEAAPDVQLPAADKAVEPSSQAEVEPPPVTGQEQEPSALAGKAAADAAPAPAKAAPAMEQPAPPAANVPAPRAELPPRTPDEIRKAMSLVRARAKMGQSRVMREMAQEELTALDAELRAAAKPTPSSPAPVAAPAPAEPQGGADPHVAQEGDAYDALRFLNRGRRVPFITRKMKPGERYQEFNGVGDTANAKPSVISEVRSDPSQTIAPPSSDSTMRTIVGIQHDGTIVSTDMGSAREYGGMVKDLSQMTDIRGTGDRFRRFVVIDNSYAGGGKRNVTVTEYTPEPTKKSTLTEPAPAPAAAQSPSPSAQAVKADAQEAKSPIVRGAKVEVVLKKGSNKIHKAVVLNVSEGQVQVKFLKSDLFNGGETQFVPIANVMLPKAARTRALNEKQFEGMTPEKKRQIKLDAGEFDTLVAAHPELGFYDYRVDMVPGKAGQIAMSKERKRASLQALLALGADPVGAHVDDSIAKSEFLPKLRELIKDSETNMGAERAATLPDDELSDNTDFLPPEEQPAVVPKLRPGEKAGDLFQGEDQPFNLAGEQGTDFERIQREKEAAEKSAEEARQLAEKQQMKLFTPEEKQQAADRTGEAIVRQFLVDRPFGDAETVAAILSDASAAELAEAIGVSVDNAKARMDAMRTPLQQALDAAHKGEEGSIINPFGKGMGGGIRRKYKPAPTTTTAIFSPPYDKGAVMRSFLQATLGKYGAFPKVLRRAIEEGQDAENAMRHRFSQLARDTKAAAKAAVSPSHDMAAIESLIDRYLRGNLNLVLLPTPRLQLAAQRMRNAIDTVSEDLVLSRAVKGNLAAVIVGNAGSWMRRSFAVFDEQANWNLDTLIARAAEPDADGARVKKILDDARSHIHADLRARGIAKRAPQDIEAIVRALTDRSELTANIFGAGKVKTDIGSYIHRKVIAPEIRALMGEETNPFLNAERSGHFLAQASQRHVMQQFMRQAGLSAGFFSLTKEGRFSEEVNAGDLSNPSWKKLWTTPEGLAAMNEAAAYASSPGWALRTVRTLIGDVKFNLVPMNPVSWVVNAIGGGFQNVMNGAFVPFLGGAKMGKAMKRALASMWHGRPGSEVDLTAANAAFREHVRDTHLQLIASGVLNSNVTMGDFAQNVGELLHLSEYDRSGVKLRDRALGLARGAFEGYKSGLTSSGTHTGGIVGAVVGGGIGASAGTARLSKAQQWWGRIIIGNPDSFWKAVSLFDNYANELRAARHEGLTQQEVMRNAAERTKNTMATYSRIPHILRRAGGFVPEVNTFFQFAWEVYRNTAWNAKYASQDIFSGTPSRRADGIRRFMGMASIAGIIAGIVAWQRAKHKWDDEKEEAFKRSFAAKWDKTSTIVPTGVNGTEISYVNGQYMVPQMRIGDIISAATKGRDALDAAKIAMRSLLGDFVQNSATVEPILEALSGTKGDYGKKISTEPEGAPMNFVERLDHIAKSQAPGIAQEIGRFRKAITGETAGYGTKYTVEQRLTRIAGLRENTYDIAKQLPYSLSDASREWTAINTARSTKTREIAWLEKTRPEEYEKRLGEINSSAVSQLEAVRVTAIVKYMDAITFGMEPREIMLAIKFEDGKKKATTVPIALRRVDIAAKLRAAGINARDVTPEMVEDATGHSLDYLIRKWRK